MYIVMELCVPVPRYVSRHINSEIAVRKAESIMKKENKRVAVFEFFKEQGGNAAI